MTKDDKLFLSTPKILGSIRLLIAEPCPGGLPGDGGIPCETLCNSSENPPPMRTPNPSANP